LLSSQNINTSDTVRQTSFVLGAYKNIPKDFEDKRYVRAIGTYNRFQRLVEEEGLKDEVLLRAQTRMAIGAIMVFDLGEVSSLYDVSLKGTWLRGQMLGLQENGAKLLRKVIQMPQTGKLNTKEYTDLFDARHEAAYLLSKRYEPENKTERENRKQKRRTKRKRRGRKS
jgi:hypothetical protein